MNNGGGVQGPWPDLVPPPEAVHLFHSYEDLKAQLLPLKSPPQQQTAEKLVSPAGSLHAAEAFAGESSLPTTAALPSLGTVRTPKAFSRAVSHSQETSAPHYASTAKGIPPAASRRNAVPACGRGKPCGSLGAPSLTTMPAVPSENTQDPHGVGALLEKKSSQMVEATAPPRYTQSNMLPTTNRFDRDEPKVQRRTRSSDAFEDPLVRDRSREEGLLDGCEQHADTSDFQGVPPEVEALLLRLQHRSCSTRTAPPFSWRRARERAKAVAAAARSSSSSSCIGTESNWKFDGDMLVPGDTAKTKFLRQEALKRVRQRAREAREKQQQELLQQQLEQEEQHLRSQVLSKQLRQRTLQRIRENALKQEEERQQQELLQQQMMRQAEVQRQYCARHRKALQQRLLQQQQEIKDKIRMHAEESVRQSRDAKARGDLIYLYL
ncbi:hypothetical protein, conserved [Eimeria praecox]|uniref:Uncharacterized protein n=1 Tax=Eimeria praecox TaxID=51316 RepID=U6GMZ2_9EIME|nr:hypothetical protein, conserved [Eimeria praecox]